MKIERQDIRAALLGFLELLESTDKQASIEILELWLGQLAFLQHFVDDIADDENHISVRPANEYARWRDILEMKFPTWGYYDIPTTHPSQIGDAIDDLVDIASEVSECLRRWEQAGSDEALWYFKFSYQRHWGAHLRNLQTYLHNLGHV